MPVIPAKESDEIVALLASGRIDDGFARLARFADLKQNDLPVLDKKALAKLGESADAARSFAAGLFSGSESIRRMARKYSGKLGAAGPGTVGLALAEAVRPLRTIANPADGLLGSFAGFASPLGKTFDELRPSTAIPPNGVYSEAAKLGAEMVQGGAAALVDGPLAWVARVFEYVSAVVRPFARLPEAPDGRPDGVDAALAAGIRTVLYEKIVALARKGDAGVLALVERWARGELTLEDPAPAGSAEARLRDRFFEIPEESRETTRLISWMGAADLLRFPIATDTAVRLYWILKAHVPAAASRDDKIVPMMLTRFEREHPRETSGPAPDPLPRLVEGSSPPPAKASAKPAEAPPAPSLPSAEKPLLDSCAGSSREDAIGALIDVAKALGLPDAWDRLSKDLGDDWTFDESWRPKPGNAPAGAEAIVDRAREGVSAMAKPSPDRKKLVKALAEPAFNGDDGTFISEDALGETAWAEELGALVASAATPMATVTAALVLLPERVLERHAGALREAVANLSDENLMWLRDRVCKSSLVRGASLVPVLGPLAERLSRREWPRDQMWMFVVALLYRSGEAGRSAATAAVRAMPLPPAEAMYRGHFWNRPYHWVFRRAWEAKDAPFLAAAFERLCIPAYFKGARAMVPDADALAFDYTAPYEGEATAARELPLADVFAFVAEAAPDSVPAILASAAEVASFEKCGAAILQIAAKLPSTRARVERHVEDLVSVLEAPEGARVKQGLDILTAIPGLLEPGLDRVLRAVERTVGSPSPGVTQSAAALVGAIAGAHRARVAECARLLEDLLYSDNVPTLEAAMKALKPLVTAAKGKGAELSAKARERVAALREQEPKKLGKLAAAILG